MYRSAYNFCHCNKFDVAIVQCVLICVAKCVFVFWIVIQVIGTQSANGVFPTSDSVRVTRIMITIMKKLYPVKCFCQDDKEFVTII